MCVLFRPSSPAKPVGCVGHVSFTLHICMALFTKEPATGSSGQSGSGTLNSLHHHCHWRMWSESRLLPWAFEESLCFQPASWPLTFCYGRGGTLFTKHRWCFYSFNENMSTWWLFNFVVTRKCQVKKAKTQSLSTLDCAQQILVSCSFFYDYCYCGAEHIML